MPKSPPPSPANEHALREHQPGEGQPKIEVSRGNGDEVHQNLASGDKSADAAFLTDNFGHRISDNQNSLWPAGSCLQCAVQCCPCSRRHDD